MQVLDVKLELSRESLHITRRVDGKRHVLEVTNKEVIKEFRHVFNILGEGQHLG